MSRFAKLVEVKERRDEESRQTTAPDSQLSTVSASQNSTTPDSPLPTFAASHHTEHPERPLATALASQQATRMASQKHNTVDRRIAEHSDSSVPPASLLSTAPPPTATRQPTKRLVDSRKLRKVDSRRGDRHKGNKVPFNNRLNDETVNRIKHFCVDHHLEQQEFVELAAIHFMDSVASQSSANADSKQAPDERELMILFKTNSSIINLYLQYNPENRWKPADDYEGVKYNEKDIRLIEVGIIHTQFNARFKKINSFKYYTIEIDEAFTAPLDTQTIDIMLKQGRRRWQDATKQD